MQYLVVLTSRAEPLEKENGWTNNGVQRRGIFFKLTKIQISHNLFLVSHKFGYGLMDASGMVELAEQWVSVPSQHICKSPELTEDKYL